MCWRVKVIICLQWWWWWMVCITWLETGLHTLSLSYFHFHFLWLDILFFFFFFLIQITVDTGLLSGFRIICIKRSDFVFDTPINYMIALELWKAIRKIGPSIPPPPSSWCIQYPSHRENTQAFLAIAYLDFHYIFTCLKVKKRVKLG